MASKKLDILIKVITAYVLSNLTPKYEHTVAIISQSYRQGLEKIDLQQLFSQLIDESRRLNNKAPSTGMDTALATTQSKQKQPNGNKKQLTYSYYKKKGHIKAKCFKKYPELRPKKDKKEEKALVATEKVLKE